MPFDFFPLSFSDLCFAFFRKGVKSACNGLATSVLITSLAGYDADHARRSTFPRLRYSAGSFLVTYLNFGQLRT